MSNYHHAVERTIYVGNIGRSVTEQALLVLFGQCGTITNIRVAGDPTFDTRYAFIEFSHPDEVRTALLLDGMHVYEHPIRVSPARGGGPLRNNDPDRVNKTIHVAGLPMEDIEEDVLAEFFAHCGEVVAVRKNGRFAWVEFATMAGMQAALSLDGEPMGNSTMKVQQSRTPIMNAGWRAPVRESDKAKAGSGEAYDMHGGYAVQDPNSHQYVDQYYGGNGSGNPPPPAPQTTPPAAPVNPAFCPPPAVPPQFMGASGPPPQPVPAPPGVPPPPGVGSGPGPSHLNGFAGQAPAGGPPSVPFQSNNAQPPPPGTAKIEPEVTN